MHAAGAHVAVVDGVAWAPHGLPDIPSLGADIYLFSLYKTYGPHQGVMAIRRQVADRLGNEGHYFKRPRCVPSAWRRRGPITHADRGVTGDCGIFRCARPAHHATATGASSGSRPQRVRELLRSRLSCRCSRPVARVSAFAQRYPAVRTDAGARAGGDGVLRAERPRAGADCAAPRPTGVHGGLWQFLCCAPPGGAGC